MFIHCSEFKILVETFEKLYYFLLILSSINTCYVCITMALPGGSDSKESACNVGDLGLLTGLGIPWRRTWQPVFLATPIFLPGESLWTEEFGGLESMGLQRVEHNWMTKHSTWISMWTNSYLQGSRNNWEKDGTGSRWWLRKLRKKEKNNLEFNR